MQVSPGSRREAQTGQASSVLGDYAGIKGGARATCCCTRIELKLSSLQRNEVLNSGGRPGAVGGWQASKTEVALAFCPAG